VKKEGCSSWLRPAFCLVRFPSVHSVASV
jgi:hypothetical protein